MKLDDYLMLYLEKFGEGFSMYQLGRGKSNSEIIDIIKDCLEKNADVYEAGYLAEDSEDEY